MAARRMKFILIGADMCSAFRSMCQDMGLAVHEFETCLFTEFTVSGPGDTVLQLSENFLAILDRLRSETERMSQKQPWRLRLARWIAGEYHAAV